MESATQKFIEEKAIVLDYLTHGYASTQASRDYHAKSAIAQALGVEHLTLLELIPKRDIHLQPMQDVYIGTGKREKIHHTKGRIPYERLTETAKAELRHAVDKVVAGDEMRFIKFFNTAQPLSMRMHQLELLPGLGKKHMWEIIDARKEKPFASFEDIKERVKLLPDAKGIIIKRIVSEIIGNEKYRIFTK
jgi:putative nucleotide binding protein